MDVVQGEVHDIMHFFILVIFINFVYRTYISYCKSKRMCPVDRRNLKAQVQE